MFDVTSRRFPLFFHTHFTDTNYRIIHFHMCSSLSLCAFTELHKRFGTFPPLQRNPSSSSAVISHSQPPTASLSPQTFHGGDFDSSHLAQHLESAMLPCEQQLLPSIVKDQATLLGHMLLPTLETMAFLLWDCARCL